MKVINQGEFGLL